MKIKKTWDKMSHLEKKVMIRFFPEEAKNDEHWYIRLLAYRTHWFTEEAKMDCDIDVKEEAIMYFSLIEQDMPEYTIEELQVKLWENFKIIK